MLSTNKSKLSREEQRDLDIEITFLEGLRRRDPGYVDALQLLGDDYTRRGLFDKGLEIDRELARLRPSDPMVFYNLGCSHALIGQFTDAFDCLNQAIDHGYRDFRWMSRDPDLAGFRQDQLYRRLRSRIRGMQVRVD